MTSNDDETSKTTGGTKPAADAAKAGATASATQNGTAASQPMSPEDAAFADLVEGSGDLFTTAVATIEKDNAARWKSRLPEHEPVNNDEAAALRALYELGDDTPVERLVASSSSGPGVSRIKLTGTDPRFIRDLEAERAAAVQALVRTMGAAADSAACAVNQSYSSLPRLHQLCLLGLSGSDAVMRRAAASDVVRLLPDLAERCATWMETVRASEAEKLGLELAALIDWRAFKAADPSLNARATGAE